MAGTSRSDGWGNQKILICGAGIAGPTMAYWLQQYGFEPTLIERAPARTVRRVPTMLYPR